MATMSYRRIKICERRPLGVVAVAR
jgi:hypothetical protein